MDPKGSNLASTDLLEISELVSGSYVTKSITGAEIIASVPPSVTAWGTITGTLSAQTDLNTALSGKVPTTRTLTINGTTQDLSADRTFTVSTGITIGTTAITSGTVGRVLFEGTGNVVQESANLFWDNTNGRLGIGTSSPAFPLDVTGTARATGSIQINSTSSYGVSIIKSSTAGVAQQIYNNFGTTYLGSDNSAGGYLFTGGLPYASFFGSGANYPTQFASNNAVRMTIFTTGNVGINTTTDAGYKLDVNGTARLNTIPIGLGGGQVATNTTVGITALSGNTSGSLNASFGYTALAFNTTGSSNTAIGFQSGYGNGTGSNNTSVGRNALITIGNYSDNTAVGAFADCVGFSGCTILGKSAVATANNQFVVGSTTTNAGAVTSEVNASTQVWNVIINGVARKILLA